MTCVKKFVVGFKKLGEDGLKMAGVAFLFTALCVFMTFDNTSDFSSGEDIEKLRNDSNLLRSKFDTLRVMRAIPYAEFNWERFISLCEFYEVDVAPVRISKEEISFYKGPLNSWSARITGNWTKVLTLLNYANAKLPVYLYDFTVKQGGKMVVDVSIVGAKQ